MTRNEQQTRFDLIDPCLRDRRGWKHDAFPAIRVEERDAAIEIIDGKARRRLTKPKDYVLYWDCSGGTDPKPIAIVEAKREGLPPDFGIQQAKDYRQGKLRHLNTVFSTNGHQFVRYDEHSGITTDAAPLAGFPTPSDLCADQAAYLGFHPSDKDAAAWAAAPDLGGLSLRYYQEAAIRAALQKQVNDIRAEQPPRVLLSLATGAGKTKLAAALLKNLDAAGRLTRALFVCDRDPLRASAIADMQTLFGSNAAAADGANPQLNAKVVVATYHTLGFKADTEESATPAADPDRYPRGRAQKKPVSPAQIADTDGAASSAASASEPPGSFLTRHYPEDYFDVIVIDECHRSAWGEWKLILDRNPRALHVGLTATPRQLEVPELAPDADLAARVAADLRLMADNHRYFGEPAYAYTYLDGVEDGYLAPCQIKTFDIFHDKRADPERLRGVLRADLAAKQITHAHTGQPLGPDAVAEQNAPSRIDTIIVIPERVLEFAEHFFSQLLAACEGDPHQKTIVFCQSDAHARRVATALNNTYAKWCVARGRKRARSFAFQCTASTHGKTLIPDFRGKQTSHFIATTVDLLSTGVDVPCVRNIVFFRYLQSPILFSQMVGRGTRIDEGTDKLMFTIWDYTGATALFGHKFLTPPPPGPGGGEPPPAPPPGPGSGPGGGPPPVQVRRTEIEIRDTGDFDVMDVDGQITRVTGEHYRALVAEKLVALCPDLADFRARWLEHATRTELIERLAAQGLAVERLPEITRQAEYDLFDLLAALVYGLEPRTRAARAEQFLARDSAWVVQLPAPSADVVRRIVRQFEAGGTPALETPELFREIVPPGQSALKILKPAGEPAEVIQRIKAGLFAA